MTVKSAPYYWLTCDALGCEERHPDDGSDTAAWSGKDDALTAAEESEWAVTDHGDYCREHSTSVCDDCGKFDPTAYAGERDYLCVACAAGKGILNCPGCGMPGGMHDRTCPNAVIEVSPLSWLVDQEEL